MFSWHFTSLDIFISLWVSNKMSQSTLKSSPPTTTQRFQIQWLWFMVFMVANKLFCWNCVSFPSIREQSNTLKTKSIEANLSTRCSTGFECRFIRNRLLSKSSNTVLTEDFVPSKLEIHQTVLGQRPLVGKVLARR